MCHGLKCPLDLSWLQGTWESFGFLLSPYCREWGRSRTSREAQPQSIRQGQGSSTCTPHKKTTQHFGQHCSPNSSYEKICWTREKVSSGTKALQPMAGRSARTANTTAVSFPLPACQRAGSHRPQSAAGQKKLPGNGVIVAVQTKDMTSGHRTGQQSER